MEKDIRTDFAEWLVDSLEDIGQVVAGYSYLDIGLVATGYSYLDTSLAVGVEQQRRSCLGTGVVDIDRAGLAVAVQQHSCCQWGTDPALLELTQGIIEKLLELLATVGSELSPSLVTDLLVEQ